jgi:hypothetical protein
MGRVRQGDAGLFDPVNNYCKQKQQVVKLADTTKAVD